MAFSTEVDQLAKELSWLRQEFDGVKSMVNGLTTPDVTFRTIKADFGEFLQPPLDSIVVNRVTTILEIPNGSWTIVNFNNLALRNGNAYSFSTLLSSFVSLKKYDNSHIHWVSGRVIFDPSSVGLRGVSVSTASTASLVAVAQLPATSGGDTIVPFSFPFVMGSSSTAISLVAYQNSGSTLNIFRADLCIVRIGVA